MLLISNCSLEIFSRLDLNFYATAEVANDKDAKIQISVKHLQSKSN